MPGPGKVQAGAREAEEEAEAGRGHRLRGSGWWETVMKRGEWWGMGVWRRRLCKQGEGCGMRLVRERVPWGTMRESSLR